VRLPLSYIKGYLTWLGNKRSR